MPRSVDSKTKREICQRLLLLRRALGKTTTEMCRAMGSSSRGSAWSNYEVGRRTISLEHAFAICREFRLTLDWIYLGDASNLPGDLQRIIRELQNPRRRRANAS